MEFFPKREDSAPFWDFFELCIQIKELEGQIDRQLEYNLVILSRNEIL